MNRVIMLLNYESEVPSAIERIAEARRQGGEAYYQTPERWLGGDCAVVDGEQTRRRVTPWLSRAAFGGLIADSNDDTGLWTIHESIAPLIDNELQNVIIMPPQCRTDRSSFVRWLSEPLIRPLISVSPEDSGFIEVIKNRVSRYASTKFICFSGVPGTGKTRLARIIADDLTDGDPYRSAEIQFHESIAYEDFVEGFVPKSDGSGFQLVKKTLRLISSRAASDPLSRLFVLIIEEFTRANTHAVLGELLTYIEHRNRRFTYALSQEDDSIPSNLVVLITMNPRDRSSQQLDNAIRRRLHYIDVSPSVSALTSMLGDKISAELMQSLQEWYTEWHSILPFGHGIFSQVLDDDGLVEVWHGTCLRLLENSIGDIDERYRSLVASFPCHQS
jgi:5-methylcytosine-specific restriction protein B